MAEHLGRIFGTEEDRVNCPFYFKIGACRHGDQCSRTHNRPVVSQTVLLKNMYQNMPAAIAMAEGQPVDDSLADEAQDHFEAFYEDVFHELTRFGEVLDMGVADNIGDHLIGYVSSTTYFPDARRSVYAKFSKEDQAESALKALAGRFYAGRVIAPEFCPVTDLSDARCRQYDDAQCSRGGFCNFIHWKHVPKAVKKRLFRRMYTEHPEYSRDMDDKKASRRKEGDDRKRGPDERRSSKRSRSRSGEKKQRRDRSEDRRAMIESWNRESLVDESQL
jgi:splicing factor U2AF subunit